MELAAAKLPIRTQFATRFARGEGVMKATEMRELDADELAARRRGARTISFRLRIQKAMGQLEAPAKIRESATGPGAGQDDAQGEGEVAMASKSTKSGRGRQRQDGEERRGRGRAPRAARRVRQDQSGPRRSSPTTRTTKPRWANASRSSRPGRMSRRKRWAVTRVIERAPRSRRTRHDPDADDPRRGRQLRRAQDLVINPIGGRPGATRGSATSSPPR